ncbi:MAG TPA: hypothetical protein VK762_16190 [Polyangiaceae bacterium]|nr:hypothetical protein [Polyangiaceae bacterium]
MKSSRTRRTEGVRRAGALALAFACAACANAERHAPPGLTADATAPRPGPAVFAEDAGGGAFDPGDSGAAAAEDAFAGPLSGPFHDFPSSPLLDMPDAGSAPSNAAQLFGPPSQGSAAGGPCLVEPEVGALYPNNWLRPRFAWTTPNSEDLFELRVHVDNQADDLVVYTPATQWTMPQSMWTALAAHSQDVPMTVAVRGGLVENGQLTSEALGSSGPIGIAPASAPGTIVYWAIVNGAQTGVLKGFAIGDEGVASVLTPSQVEERGAGGVPCIGCHASTPDGANVGFSIGYDEGSPGAYTDGIATIGKTATPGLVPSFLTPDAKRTMDGLGGIPAYSPSHWKAGDRVVLLSDTGDLHWVNLEATGAQVTGVVARGPADSRLATDPSWSRDGTTIVYTSAGSVYNGRQQGSPMDLYAVPYAGGDGGVASPIAGASQANVDEYYPALSPDDQYVVFNGAPAGDNPYSDPRAELFVVPRSGAPGGVPVRLNANDPPACTGEKSPGVTNSWAKWSPTAQPVAVLGRTYYWVVFSSTRYPSGPAQDSPQLYVTAVVVDARGAMTTYPALYLWNQPATEHNHTPAWDVFLIPPPPPPPITR